MSVVTEEMVERALAECDSAMDGRSPREVMRAALNAVAADIVAAERERCARTAEVSADEATEAYPSSYIEGFVDGCNATAVAIRARRTP